MNTLLWSEQGRYWAYCLTTKWPASFYEWKYSVGRCAPEWLAWREERQRRRDKTILAALVGKKD